MLQKIIYVERKNAYLKFVELDNLKYLGTVPAVQWKSKLLTIVQQIIPHPTPHPYT